jgi:hypothetical protein
VAPPSRLTEAQEQALMGETQMALAFVVEGLAGLKWLALDVGYYRMPFLLIGQGIERLLKLAICTARLKQTNVLPTFEEIRAYRHDLSALLDDASPLCETFGIDREDLDNADARALLSIMTDLGAWARYYDLDTLLGRPIEVRPQQEPLEALNLFRHEIAKRNPDVWDRLWGEFLVGHPRKLVKYMNSEMRATLQRFMRVLCRFLIAATPLDESGPLQLFASLDDPYGEIGRGILSERAAR